MQNLLKETLHVLESNGVTEKDVEWVGCLTDGSDYDGPGYWFSWDDFADLAAQTTYDNGFGSQQVVTNLVIVGPDWYLDRGEYDGSEWWDFHRKPARPDLNAVPPTLLGGMWGRIIARDGKWFNQYGEEVGDAEV